MFLNFITCVPNKSLDQFWSALHAPFRLKNQRFHLRKIITGCIRQFSHFQIAPNPFRWIEVRCIPRQLLQVDPLRSTRSQIGFEFLGPMSRVAIPNHQQQTRDQTLQLPKKGDDFFAGNRVVVNFQKQPTLRGDGSDK